MWTQLYRKRTSPFLPIPLIHNIRNDLGLVATCLEMIMGVAFKLSLKQSQDFHYIPGASLGQCGLGVDLVTESYFQGDENALEITIGPIVASDLPTWVSGERNDSLLEELLGDFISADYDVMKELITEENFRDIILDSGILLGMNSFI